MRKTMIIILISIFILTGGYGKEAHAAATELYSMSFYSDANLSSYYRLENTSDSKGVYNLTNTNSVAFNAGKFNNGADFGSSNTTKYLATNTPASIPPLGITQASDKSECLWVNMSAQPGAGGLYTISSWFYGVTGGTYLKLIYSNSVFVASKYALTLTTNSNLSTSSTGVLLATGVWNNVCFTKSGTTYTLYLNGVSCGTDIGFTGGYGSYGNWFSLGTTKNNSELGNYLSGLIDDVSIFSRALSAAEVLTIYQGEATPASLATPNNNIIIFE